MKLADLEGKLEEKSQLVVRLEEDLLAADARDSSGNAASEKASADTIAHLAEGKIPLKYTSTCTASDSFLSSNSFL